MSFFTTHTLSLAGQYPIVVREQAFAHANLPSPSPLKHFWSGGQDPLCAPAHLGCEDVNVSKVSVQSHSSAPSAL